MIAVFLIFSVPGLTKNKESKIKAYQEQKNLIYLEDFSTTSEKLDSTISEMWNQDDNSWIFTGRKKYAYTVNGNITTAITSKQDISTLFIWSLDGKTETTTNAAGKTILNTTYSWNKTTSQWKPSMKMEFTFDAKGNLTSNSTYMGNPITGSWNGLFKTEYTLDATGNMISDIGYSWDTPTNSWVKSGKTEYTYTNGRTTLDISYDWDDATTSWIKSGKTEHTYNSNGRNTMDITYKWDETIAVPNWVKEDKMDLTYDANGNMTMEISSKWDVIASIWVNSDKTELSFNANGEMTMYSMYSWDENTNKWIGMMKNTTSFGTMSGGVKYSVSTSYLWNEDTSNWIVASRSTSYYSNQTSIVNEISAKNLRVFPNPARELIVIELANLSENTVAEIFDIQGKKVFEQKISVNKQISVSHFQKGLYLYKLNNNGKIYSGKILIE